MGLRINEEKTKYMGMSPTQVKGSLEEIIRDDFKLEAVEKFTHFGSLNNVI